MLTDGSDESTVAIKLLLASYIRTSPVLGSTVLSKFITMPVWLMLPDPSNVGVLLTGPASVLNLMVFTSANPAYTVLQASFTQPELNNTQYVVSKLMSVVGLMYNVSPPLIQINSLTLSVFQISATSKVWYIPALLFNVIVPVLCKSMLLLN
jgi:hypothetical protein